MYYKLSECYTVFYSICFVGVFLYNLQQVVEIPIKKINDRQLISSCFNGLQLASLCGLETHSAHILFCL